MSPESGPLSRYATLLAVIATVLLSSCGGPSDSHVTAGTGTLDEGVIGRRVRVQAVNQDIVAIAQDVIITEEMLEALDDTPFGVYQSSWLDVHDGDRYKIGLWEKHPDFEKVRLRTQQYIDELASAGAPLRGDVVLVFFEFSRNDVHTAKADFGEELEASNPTELRLTDSINETTMRLDVFAEESAVEAAKEFASRYPTGLVNVIEVESLGEIVQQ